MSTVVTAAQLLLPDSLLADPVLTIEEGRIASLATRAEAELPTRAEHHDYPGALLAPAFLDVHTHGCRGRDVMEGTSEALGVVNRFLARHGVGAYLPTTISASKDATLRALAGLARQIAASPEPGCAQPLGIHLEGPFLSHARRGAHPSAQLLAPSIPFFDTMWEAAEGRVTLMTIAPELPGALPLIAHATGKGVRISIGHSDSSADEAEQAIAAGAASATHTFNAMRKLDHRAPGILGAVLAADNLFAEIICDGLHVDPLLVKLFARAKGERRAILVTDAMSAAGMPDGTYKLGELEVQVTAGRAITGVDTLAGSTLTLDRGVRQYMRFAQLPLAAAVYAATRNPAQMAGLEDAAGSLGPGGRADLNVLAPDGMLRATYLGGLRVGV